MQYCTNILISILCIDYKSCHKDIVIAFEDQNSYTSDMKLQILLAGLGILFAPTETNTSLSARPQIVWISNIDLDGSLYNTVTTYMNTPRSAPSATDFMNVVLSRSESEIQLDHQRVKNAIENIPLLFRKMNTHPVLKALLNAIYIYTDIEANISTNKHWLAHHGTYTDMAVKLSAWKRLCNHYDLFSRVFIHGFMSIHIADFAEIYNKLLRIADEIQIIPNYLQHLESCDAEAYIAAFSAKKQALKMNGPGSKY